MRLTNTLTRAREGLRHLNGCYRWTGDGRCVDCHRYTGIPSAVVEFAAGGVVHYYDRQAVERYGLRSRGAVVGAIQPLAPAPPGAPAAGRVVNPSPEQDGVRRDGARFGGVEPISERDLVRRGTPAAGPQPLAPVLHGDAGRPRLPAQPPQEAPVAQPQRSPDVVHAGPPPEPLETSIPAAKRDAGEDNGPAEFLVNLKRAQQQLALAGQQPKPKARAKRKK